MRPTSFHPDTCRAVTARIAAGATIAEAAATVDLKPRTVQNWISRGRKEESGPYSDFADDVARARHEAKTRPDPMTYDELKAIVSETAAKGSVAAQKLYWEMILDERNGNEAEEPEAEAAPLGGPDELALRRAA